MNIFLHILFYITLILYCIIYYIVLYSYITSLLQKTQLKNTIFELLSHKVKNKLLSIIKSKLT